MDMLISDKERQREQEQMLARASAVVAAAAAERERSAHLLRETDELAHPARLPDPTAAEELS